MRIQGSISPDGAKIAFLGPVDGVLNIWVQPLGGEARPVTPGGGGDILVLLGPGQPPARLPPGLNCRKKREGIADER
ncbi:MAG TPA: hypothetical protein VMF65_01695 [Acidimicrobiales bacterium]|nr:hypothetical protein [Acidimicrobiales bacterium]